MAIFERLRTPKKAIEEANGLAVFPIQKPGQPKNLHIPIHAAADSLNMIARPVKSDMLHKVGEKMCGTESYVAPKLSLNPTWSARDFSSFSPPNRRPSLRRNTSIARYRNLLANTIVEEEEELLESSSSDSDRLEVNYDHRWCCLKPNDDRFATHMPELVSDTLIEDSILCLSPSSVVDTCTSLKEPLPRLKRRSRSTESFNSTSAADRPEQEHIARQTEAYNTVLSHLYPEGKSSVFPLDSTRHLHRSQRLSQQLKPTGSRRNIYITLERNQTRWNYPVQQADVSNSRNEVQKDLQRERQIPYVQIRPEEGQFQDSVGSPQPSLRRISASSYRNTPEGTVHVSRYPSPKHASFDGMALVENGWQSQYEQDYFTPQQDVRSFSLDSLANQAFEQPFTNYSGNRVSFTRHKLYDSHIRASFIQNHRHSIAIDDRVAKAHMEYSYRQSKLEPTVDHAEIQSLAETDERACHLGIPDFPQPPSNDSNRKLRPLLGSEQREGRLHLFPPAPLSDRPMLSMPTQSPIMIRLGHPSAPNALRRVPSTALSGKKVLNMPRSTYSIRKRKSFMGLLRRKKNSETLRAIG